MNKRTFGRIGEQNTVLYLKKHGYRIITTNYGTSHGELDIVALKRRVLVFVEVKTKTGTENGAPADELTKAKKAALYRAGAEFCRFSGEGLRVPVSVCGITVKQKYKSRRFDLIEQIIADGELVTLIHTTGVMQGSETQTGSSYVIRQHERNGGRKKLRLRDKKRHSA